MAQQAETDDAAATAVACAACGEVLDLDSVVADPGICPGCGAAVCFVCGCVEARACYRPEEAPHTCSWMVPGVCTFCYFAVAEAAYRAAAAEDFGALERLSDRLEVIDWLVGFARGVGAMLDGERAALVTS